MQNSSSLPKFKLTKTVVTRFTRPGEQYARGKTSTAITTSYVMPAR